MRKLLFCDFPNATLSFWISLSYLIVNALFLENLPEDVVHGCSKNVFLKSFCEISESTGRGVICSFRSKAFNFAEKDSVLGVLLEIWQSILEYLPFFEKTMIKVHCFRISLWTKKIFNVIWLWKKQFFLCRGWGRCCCFRFQGLNVYCSSFQLLNREVDGEARTCVKEKVRLPKFSGFIFLFFLSVFLTKEFFRNHLASSPCLPIFAQLRVIQLRKGYSSSYIAAEVYWKSLCIRMSLFAVTYFIYSFVQRSYNQSKQLNLDGFPATLTKYTYTMRKLLMVLNIF